MEAVLLVIFELNHSISELIHLDQRSPLAWTADDSLTRGVRHSDDRKVVHSGGRSTATSAMGVREASSSSLAGSGCEIAISVVVVNLLQCRQDHPLVTLTPRKEKSRLEVRVLLLSPHQAW
nr:hypothetical protein Q903MT_gene2154 [Picea sitchensis]